MIDYVCLVLAFFGTNFAKPSTPLDLLKVMAVIDSICKRWKKGLKIIRGKMAIEGRCCTMALKHNMNLE